MLVSLAGIEGVYASHHFDGCDYVVCASNEQIKDFVAFNRKRNLPQITLVKGGYPKLDQQLREMPKRDQISLNHIVAYAPTHVYAANEGLASLLSHGKSIVRELLELGYHVVFRPHPASFGVQDEVACIDDIVASFGGNPSFSLDTSKNYNQTYSQCAVLITDLSGTGFTFALSQQRPAVFFAPNADAERGLHGVHFRDRERVGFVVRSIEDLRICVPAAIVNERVHSEQIERYRVETMFNPGRSETEITRALLAIFEGDSHPSFMQLEHD
jgi:CDP-glycerol glycerophosphotransferase (TagB/SpsB family)